MVISLENLREVYGDDCNGTKVLDRTIVADYKKEWDLEYNLYFRALRTLGTVTSRPLQEPYAWGEEGATGSIRAGFLEPNMGDLVVVQPSRLWSRRGPAGVRPGAVVVPVRTWRGRPGVVVQPVAAVLRREPSILPSGTWVVSGRSWFP